MSIVFECVYLIWHDETENENNDSFMIGWQNTKAKWAQLYQSGDISANC